MATFAQWLSGDSRPLSDLATVAHSPSIHSVATLAQSRTVLLCNFVASFPTMVLKADEMQPTTLNFEGDAADEADNVFEVNHCPDDLQMAKNRETYFIPEDGDDEKETRMWCAIVKCPAYEDCNKENYRKACVWSFQSTEMCQKYLLNHLYNKHKMTPGEGVRCIQCSDLQWEFGQDGYDDRDRYRNQLKTRGQGSSKKARLSSQALANTGSCSSAGNRGSSAPIMEGIDVMMNRALASQMQVLMDGEEQDITHYIHERQQRELAGLGVEPCDDVTMSHAQLKHLRDTMVRADGALGHAKTRSLELSMSIHREQIIVRDAIVCVDRISQRN